MILGPLSRVMMVRQPFCAKNMQTSHFLCAKFSPARAVLYLQLNRALLWSNRTAQRFNTTAGVRNYGTAWFCKTSVRCHSFWEEWPRSKDTDTRTHRLRQRPEDSTGQYSSWVKTFILVAVSGLWAFNSICQ